MVYTLLCMSRTLTFYVYENCNKKLQGNASTISNKKKGTKSSFYSINLNICNFDAIAWYYTFTTSSTSKVIFLVQMEKESRENRIFVF